MKYFRQTKLTVALIAIALLCMMLPVLASAATVVASGTCGAQGDNLVWTLDSDGTLTISGRGNMKDYGYYDDLPWDAYYDKIQKIIISSGVTSIGDFAFSCMNVTHVAIPYGVKTIGERAFDLSSISTITLPSSITTIYDGAFMESDLTSIALPYGLTSIAYSTFRWCDKLTDVTIPDSVTSIEQDAFTGCTSLRNLTIPASVRTIDNFAFGYQLSTDATGYTRLDGVTITGVPGSAAETYAKNNNITFIPLSGVVASGNCGAQGSNVTWTLDNNGTLTISGSGAMADFSSDNIPWGNYSEQIKVAEILSGVTRIGDLAFYGCESLTSIVIPSGVTGIGQSAFAGCWELASVEIPSSVTRIDYAAFAQCRELTTVTLPSGLTSIASRLFMESGLKSITIPAGVTSIGYEAFRGCALTSIVIPSGVIEIGSSAFADCSALTSITLPSDLTGISDYMFRWCEKLTNVTIPSSVTTIGTEAFANCESLKNLTIPATVKAIGSHAFGYWETDWLSYDWRLYNDVAIIGMPGTAAETYAKNNNIPFIDQTNLDTPKLSSVTFDTTGVTIMWDKVPGAEKYRVFYKTTGGWKKLTDTTATSYTWTKAKSGTKYAFTVRCINSAATSYTSAYDTTGKSVTYIAAPKVSSVTNAVNGVTIKWGKVTGAENYRVFYKTTGSWKKLTDTTKTSYTWTKAKSGTTYAFTVRCISKTGKSYTSAYDTTGKSITYIAAPKVSSVTNAVGGITIKWGKVTGAVKYRVFYKTTGSWKKLTDTTSTSYTWKKAKSGTKYSFTVRCLSATGKSYTSNYDTTGKSITYVAAPKVSSVKGNAKSGVTIKWGKVTGAVKYRVYYKTTGGWKKLTDTTKTSYTWQGAKKGTYAFTVCCISSTGKSKTSAYDTKGVSFKVK